MTLRSCECGSAQETDQNIECNRQAPAVPRGGHRNRSLYRQSSWRMIPPRDEEGFGYFGQLLGFVIAGAFEFLDDRLYREKEIKALLPIPVISEVPAIVTEQDARKTKMSLVLGWATTAVVFTVIVAGSLFSFIHQ